jgi:hypothetical protein
VPLHTVPAVWQVRLLQQAWLVSPQATQLPLEQAVVVAVQVPLQQGWLAPPQVPHEPAAQVPRPPGQALPAPVQELFTQQPPLEQELPGQHG